MAQREEDAGPGTVHVTVRAVQGRPPVLPTKECRADRVNGSPHSCRNGQGNGTWPRCFTERFRVRTWAGAKEIALLEKRIEKLYSQLAALENALSTISSSKVQNNQAILNAMRQLGLVNDDKYFEKKREMLKFVFDTNKDIRKSAKDLEAQGITLASPKRTVAS